MKRKTRPKSYKPDREEIDAMRRFQKIPTSQKLRALDNYRAFMYEIWHCNPETRKDYERLQEKFK